MCSGLVAACVLEYIMLLLVLVVVPLLHADADHTYCAAAL
jgi:hypothetical protein